LAVGLAAWPEIIACLLDRVAERAEHLATMQAILQPTGVDRRLLALFWHLAERWGRVGTAGIMIPVALTHRILGHLVGAARPTISSALGELARRDQFVGGPRGSWLLRGTPPTPAPARARRFSLPHEHQHDLLGPKP
jgi:CRP-like cAMP-binding protein